MSAMQSEVYEAFRAIDIPEAKALRAAAASTTAFSAHDASVSSSFDKRDADIASIRGDLGVMRDDLSNLKLDLATTKGDVASMKWMIGFTLAFQATMFAQLFLH